MSKTRITMIRHGETEWNIALRLQGIQNSNLTQRGEKQAIQVGESLKEKEFDKLITSDLQRAIDTANLMNRHLKLPVELNKDLRERNFGIMEGLTREQILEAHPETFHAYMKRRDTFPIPNGESLEVFYKRVINGINKVVDDNSGKELLIVTHGGVLDCMIRMIFNYSLSAPRKFSIFNASINIFSCKEETWKLECWGNIDHQDRNTLSIDEPGK